MRIELKVYCPESTYVEDYQQVSVWLQGAMDGCDTLNIGG